MLIFIDTLLPSFKSNDMTTIQRLAHQFHYKIIAHTPEKIDLIYQKEKDGINIHIFSKKFCIGALLHSNNNHLIFIKEHHFELFDEYEILLFILFVLLLTLFFVYLFFSTINAIKELELGIKRISGGDYDFEITYHKQDEIGSLIQTFKNAKNTIVKILKGRELILRGLGHELKTSLTKMKLLLGLKEIKTQDDIKMLKYINELQKVSENILELERINDKSVVVETHSFLSETLLFEALCGFEEEQEKIHFTIKENCLIKSDLRLLTVVVKNLIDNALKYTMDGKVYVECAGDLFIVKNKGQPLKYDINYYLKPFYRDDRHHAIIGHGLGLSIINEITKILQLGFSYKYEDGHHHFIINLRQKD